MSTSTELRDQVADAIADVLSRGAYASAGDPFGLKASSLAAATAVMGVLTGSKQLPPHPDRWVENPEEPGTFTLLGEQGEALARLSWYGIGLKGFEVGDWLRASLLHRPASAHVKGDG